MASRQAEEMKAGLVELMKEFQGDSDEPPSLLEMRTVGARFGEIATEPHGVAWTDVDAGGVPAKWADPEGGATDRVLQYVHGGGYVIGSAASYRRFTGHLAKAVGCRVLSVDYRLAPEHPHPAPLEDSLAAYRWLLSQGYPSSRIAIAGDSAGGGLTLSTLLALRDAGEALPAASVPISPWADMEALGETMTSNADRDVLVQTEGLLGMAGLFLAGQDARAPLASPVYGDYSGVPPMYIQVGGDETLLDDARTVAEAAKRDGVDVTLEIFPEMQHVFQMGAGHVPEADAALEKIGGFLRGHLGH